MSGGGFFKKYGLVVTSTDARLVVRKKREMSVREFKSLLRWKSSLKARAALTKASQGDAE